MFTVKLIKYQIDSSALKMFSRMLLFLFFLFFICSLKNVIMSKHNKINKDSENDGPWDYMTPFEEQP